MGKYSCPWASGVIALILLCVSAHAASDKPKPERPTTVIDPASCVTPDCHADVKRYKRLHGPVNANTCDACHELTDAKKHTFAPSREKAELCTYCHEFDISKMPVLHTPVVLGECTGCHDPHGGNDSALVRGATRAELCERCHESITKNKKYVHTPVAVEECDSCHRPHGSKYPKLVNAAGEDLCLACHVEFGVRLASSKFVHKAMDKGCNQCHDVHGSSQPMALSKPLPDLCLGNCHEKVKTEFDKTPYKHTVAMKDRACLTCHASHGSDLSGLMADLPRRICMECHDKPAKSWDGREIPAATEVADSRTGKHGPVRDGQCNGCHMPHGADRPLFLPKSYTTSFYLPFTPENYQLCFMCHSRQLVQSEQTADATNFRNGTRNLHYVHVMSDRGRNCRVCHTNHAANNDRGIRDSVKFGKWQIPIKFRRTGTGGTCDTGCHLTYSYDRKNPLPAATTQPAPRVSPKIDGGSDAPTTLAWTGPDLLGAEVIVPEPARPTVMLLVRAAETSVEQAVLKLVERAVADANATQVVLVLCGPGANEQGKLIATLRNLHWRIVADPEDAMARKIGVYSWPSTIIVKSDSGRVAHLTGAAESLPVQIGAYLEFATGKINATALNQRLAKFEIVVDDPAKRAARHIELARKLLEEGKAENARKVLADALRIQPDSPAAKAAMVEVLIQLKQGNDAEELLNAIPAAAIPAWQRDFLGAKLALAGGRMPAARTLLLRVIKAKPDLAEAHLLLGQAYERNQDWQKAAGEYRAYMEMRRGK